jgi:hypothetical protein
VRVGARLHGILGEAETRVLGAGLGDGARSSCESEL